MIFDDLRKSRRVLAPLALFAAGFVGSLRVWSPAAPERRARPAQTTADDVSNPGRSGIRPENIPRLIGQYERRIDELEQRNRHIDAVRVGYDRPTDYRQTRNEIDSRGRASTLLLVEQQANSRMIDDLRGRVLNLRREAGHTGDGATGR